MSAKFLHLASVIDLAIGSCFLDHQDIKLGPRNMQELGVDHLSSISKAQYASQKPLSPRGYAGLISNP